MGCSGYYTDEDMVSKAVKPAFYSIPHLKANILSYKRAVAPGLCPRLFPSRLQRVGATALQY